MQLSHGVPNPFSFFKNISNYNFPFQTPMPVFLFLREAHKSSSLHSLCLLTEAPGGSFLSLFATQCAGMLFHLQPRSISSIHSEVWDLRDSTGKQRDLYDTSYCFRLSLILHKTCSFEAWAISIHTHFQRFLKFTCIVEQLYCISFQVSFSLNSFGNGDGIGSPYTGTFLLSE